MDIDLSLLHSNTVNSIDISGSYSIDSSYYENSDVVRFNSLSVNGSIVRRENDDLELNDYVTCTIDGVMILKDSISLEEVEYPFSCEYDDFIDENCKKYENTLDIFQFLWENTVLEVPLQFTKVRDLSKFHGDGWKLISEDDIVTSNNPFSDLLKDFDKE